MHGHRPSGGDAEASTNKDVGEVVLELAFLHAQPRGDGGVGRPVVRRTVQVVRLEDAELDARALGGEAAADALDGEIGRASCRERV